MGKVIIDGKAVYEIDEVCMRKKEQEKKQKKEDMQKEKQNEKKPE